VRPLIATFASEITLCGGVGSGQVVKILNNMVLFETVTFASEITLCGGVGSGQVVKILNNMVLFETVLALSEARAIARRSGVDVQVLLETFTRGSADSFALRNHGLKAILPGDFPERAFSVEYARKDLRYALSLAAQTGVQALGAENVEHWFAEAIKARHADRYFPVISRVVDKDGESA